MPTPRALVIGGSLGGLFAAHMLRSVGLEVDVFERSGDDLASRGAGIGTHEEMLAVIQRIGIPAAATMGVKVCSRICLDRKGRVTHRTALARVMSAWAHLYNPLKALLPAANYHFHMGLSRVEPHAAGVTAIFEDGTRITGDLLIAADGTRSTVREQLMPQVRPQYAGYVGWRGVLPEDEFTPELHEALFEHHLYCLPDGEMMLGYMVPGRNGDLRPGHRAYNFVWYRPVDERAALPALCTDAEGRCHGTAVPPPMIRPDCIADMKAAARALLAPQIAEVVERTARPFFQAIFDLESPRMAEGRVALLGDAAFVARPHVGMGVTKAALDAQCLADAIAAAEGDLDHALAGYDAERRLFGERVVARARALGAHLAAGAGPGPHLLTDAEGHQVPERVLRECGANLSDIPELAKLTAASAVQERA
jgi:2-polyprenyl-6-methoxyphenol hydroxylase-like FAD-dependent oxidoreductase